MTRWLKEPLLHFALVAIIAFGVHRRRDPAADHRIVLSDSDVAALVAAATERSGRPPDDGERRTLIAARVRDEVLLREALAEGLSVGDPVVRRRLIQSMEFLAEESDSTPEPSDAELSAYLDAHADAFATEPTVEVTHVFVKAGDDAAGRVRALREQLVGGADPATLGDPFLRGQRFAGKSRTALGVALGEAVARAAFAAKPGAWSEPLASPLGLHLLRVDARRDAERPALGVVRGQVRARLLDERRTAARERAIAELVSRYDVVVPGAGK